MESKALSIENRNRTYASLVENLSQSRKLVYDAIKKLGTVSLDKVCFYLGKPKNALSGRITELKSQFFIKEVGIEKSGCSQNSVTLYAITTEAERIELINRRYSELRSEKDALINDYNLDLSSLSKELLKKELGKLSKEQKTLEIMLEAINMLEVIYI